MAWDDVFSGSFGINLGISPGEWFGEDRPDEVRAANVAEQRLFAQNAIRWRVEDAKAAGLHPLFALSGGGASFSPNPVTVSDSTSIAVQPGDREAGARKRDQALPVDEFLERRQQDDHARTVSQIATDTEQQSLLRAQTDLVRQQIEDSIKARTDGHAGANKERSVARPVPTMPTEAYEVKPRQVLQGTESSGETIAVGPPSPAFEPVWIAPGMPALVPAGAGQNLGDMETSGWLMSLGATLAWWGSATAEKLYDVAKRQYSAVLPSWEVIRRKAEELSNTWAEQQSAPYH